jgi:hypothetical protein
MSRRLLTASLLCAAVPCGIGLAGPASATDGITQDAVGTYVMTWVKNPTNTLNWVVTPCDGDVDHCIHVSEYSPTDTALKHSRWSANAHWSVGSWIFDPVESTRSCKDGTKYPVTYNYAWDADINSGWRSYHDPGTCDDIKAGDASAQFTLTKVA